MKRISLLVACLAFLASCKKDQFLELRSQFSDKWEYEKYISQFNSPPLPPGNGKIIVIRQNGSFERFAHDTLLFNGKYLLEERTDCGQGTKQVFFKTNDPSFANDNAVSVEADRLILGTSNCVADGGAHVYRRVP